MSSIEQLRADLKAKQNELQDAHGAVAELDEVMADMPDDPEMMQARQDAMEVVEDIKNGINSIKASIASAESESATVAPPKFDMSKHPKFRKVASETPPPPPEDAPVTFNVKDTVMAKWSGDKSYYEATVIDKTGSAADPVYTVKFTYDESKETKRKFEIRPMAGKKRKAEADVPANPAAVPAPVATKSADGTTISKGPMLNASYVPEKPAHVPSQVKDGPTRMKPEPKKLKSNKALEKKASSWQAFQQKGPGVKKPSQFKTPDSPTVSVVSSGRPMTKDQKPSRYAKHHDGAEEED